MAEYDSVPPRVWRGRRKGGWAWAPRLEHPWEGAVRRFHDPEAMVAAQWALVGPRAPTGPGPPETGGTEAPPMRRRG